MIGNIGSKIVNLAKKVTGSQVPADADNPQIVKDTISMRAKYGIDAMLTPGLRTFDNYAKVGKPYVKNIKELAAKGSPEWIMADTALSARGESARYTGYYNALMACFTGVNGPISAVLAKTGTASMMDSHFKTYQQGADSGKPWLKAIKEHVKSDSINGKIARAALNASGETGKYGAYLAALKTIELRQSMTPVEGLAVSGYMAINNSTFKVYQHCNNAAKPFLKALAKETVKGTIDDAIVKAALKVKGETSQYAAWNASLKKVFMGINLQNTMVEELADTALAAMTSRDVKTMAAGARIGKPFLEAIRDNSPKGSKEYTLAKDALKHKADDWGYGYYKNTLQMMKSKPKPKPKVAPLPPAPKSDALDFIEDKKKAVEEGRDSSGMSKEKKIEILENTVNIGGVTLKRTSR